MKIVAVTSKAWPRVTICLTESYIKRLNLRRLLNSEQLMVKMDEM